MRKTNKGLAILLAVALVSSPVAAPVRAYAASTQATYNSLQDARGALAEAIRNRQTEVQFNVSNIGSVTQQALYDLYNGAMSQLNTYEQLGVTMAGAQMGTNPGWFTTSGWVKVQLSYRMSAQQNQEFTAKLSQVMSSLALNGKSDYDKALAIVEYINKNVKLDNNSGDIGYTEYGALINGKASNHGFAALFYRMAKAAGLETDYVTASGKMYGFNAVKIDGTYYFVDSAWDTYYMSYGGKHTYFLLGSNNMLKDRTLDATLSYQVSATDYVPSQEPDEPVPVTDPVLLTRNARVTQDIPGSLRSDTLEAILDGVTTPAPHTSGLNKNSWTNYNSAQAGNPNALLYFTLPQKATITQFDLYFFTDSWSATLPESVTFHTEGIDYGDNEIGNALGLLDAKKTSETRLSSTTVKVTYKVNYENAGKYPIDNFCIQLVSKDGKNPSSNAAYCVGLNEVEAYGIPESGNSFFEVPSSYVKNVTVGSEQPIAKNAKANAIDDDPSTIWHTSWNGASQSERYITLELSEAMEVTGLKYIPRDGYNNGDNNGRVNEYKVSVSADGKNFTTLATGSWKDAGNTKYALVSNPSAANVKGINAKYVRLEGISTYGDGGANKFMSAAEVVVLVKK